MFLPVLTPTTRRCSTTHSPSLAEPGDRQQQDATAAPQGCYWQPWQPRAHAQYRLTLPRWALATDSISRSRSFASPRLSRTHERNETMSRLDIRTHLAHAHQHQLFNLTAASELQTQSMRLGKHRAKERPHDRKRIHEHHNRSDVQAQPRKSGRARRSTRIAHPHTVLLRKESSRMLHAQARRLY